MEFPALMNSVILKFGSNAALLLAT